MTSSAQKCRACSIEFFIEKEDLEFYEKISPIFNGKKAPVPSPTLCPQCRKQRRLVWRNERKLYHRQCDLSGKPILSSFSSDKSFKVYRQQEWWSDQNDATKMGRAFDFSRPFFEQFAELFREVPHMNVIGANNENSDYCNLTANCKNCYLVFESSNNQDCLYGNWLQKSEDCCDSAFSHECRSCYEVNGAYNCERLRYSQNCTNCSDSAFLFDCVGCRDCFMCVNLRQKQYCIFNQQLTQAEYEQRSKEFRLGSHQWVAWAKAQFETFKLRQIHRDRQMTHSENCSGDYIQNSRNCVECFHAHEAEDCKYGEHVWRDSKNNMDVSTVGRNAQWIYESINNGMDVYHNLFCVQCWTGSRDLMYCYSCFSCQDSFGCVGLKKKRFCILNKQYSKEQYEALVPKIIAAMTLTKEWGEFFPLTLSPFAYNETVVQEYFPLTQEQVLNAGLTWKEDENLSDYMGPKIELPDDIQAVEDALCTKVLLCTRTGKPYKIIPQELEFYRKMNVPLPRISPDQRHLQRVLARNSQTLWSRTCSDCGQSIQSTYAPNRPERVVCEACYLKTVY